MGKAVYRFCLSLLMLCTAGIRGQEIRLLTPRLMDLGKYAEGTLVQDTIRFVNSGTAAVHITSVRTTCGCAAANIENTHLASGDTAVIPFSLDTSGFKGITRKSFSVYFTNNQPSSLEWVFQVEVYHELETDPKYFYFQRTRRDSLFSITRTLSVISHSASPLTIQRIRISSDMVRIDPETAVIPPDRSGPGYRCDRKC